MVDMKDYHLCFPVEGVVSSEQIKKWYVEAINNCFIEGMVWPLSAYEDATESDIERMAARLELEELIIREKANN